MVKITQCKSELNTIIKIEGKLLSPWLGELRGVCDEAMAVSRNVHLDLASVNYADNAGIKLIHELRMSGVRLACCSNYLAELLRMETP